MVDSAPVDTFLYEIGGQEIWFKTTTRPQILAIQRQLHWIQEDYQKRVDEAANEEEKSKIYLQGMDTVDQFVWDLVEARFINPDDIRHVNMAIAKGAVTIDDAYAIFANGQKKESTPDDTPVPVKTTKRTPAKKTAAKAANARRTRK